MPLSKTLYPLLSGAGSIKEYMYRKTSRHFMRGSSGGEGVRNPTETSQNIGFLSNTSLDPLKNHKATKPAFNVGPLSARQRNAKWRFAGMPMMARLKRCLDPPP